jgi:hypothetical protein
MPCANVHLMLAGRVLDRWTAAPSTAPVPHRDPEVRAAFLAGALAPDAGFVPGTDRTVSELAHYVRPGDLTRNLLEVAAGPVEQAFALGWATHVMGDVALHPLVGRAVGERLFGDRDRRVNTADDEETHVSIEVGLDLAVGDAEGPGLPAPPDRRWDAGAGTGHLVRALEATYGGSWSRTRLHRDQAQGAFFMRRWGLTLAVVRKGWPGRPEEEPAHLEAASGGAQAPAAAPGALARLLRLGRRLVPEASAPRGLLAPSTPPTWLVHQVLEEAETFAARFEEAAHHGLLILGNRSLETGEEQPRGSGHPATDRAWMHLDPPGRLR